MRAPGHEPLAPPTARGTALVEATAVAGEGTVEIEPVRGMVEHRVWVHQAEAMSSALRGALRCRLRPAAAHGMKGDH